MVSVEAGSFPELHLNCQRLVRLALVLASGAIGYAVCAPQLPIIHLILITALAAILMHGVLSFCYRFLARPSIFGLARLCGLQILGYRSRDKYFVLDAQDNGVRYDHCAGVTVIGYLTDSELQTLKSGGHLKY